MATGSPLCSTLARVAMLLAMLEHDRRRAGWSVEQAARRLGVSVRTYRDLEAGERSPTFETWDRICKLKAGRRRSPMANSDPSPFGAYADGRPSRRASASLSFVRTRR
jgi:transcriptional regulator with XRE-family HTH domain